MTWSAPELLARWHATIPYIIEGKIDGRHDMQPTATGAASYLKALDTWHPELGTLVYFRDGLFGESILTWGGSVFCQAMSHLRVAASFVDGATPEEIELLRRRAWDTAFNVIIQAGAARRQAPKMVAPPVRKPHKFRVIDGGVR